MAQVHVITGIERRRRWSEEEKREIVAAAFAPGAAVREVARRADVSSGQIYRWRRELGHSGSGFAEVVVAAGVPAVSTASEPVIEVVVGDGARVRIGGSVSPELAVAVIGALKRPLEPR